MFTQKEKEDILKRIIIEVGDNTVTELCKKHRITPKTFYEWLNDSDFKLLKTEYNNAKYKSTDTFYEDVILEARRQLFTKVQSGEFSAIKLALEQANHYYSIKVDVINKLADRLGNLSLEGHQYKELIEELKVIEKE